MRYSNDAGNPIEELEAGPVLIARRYRYSATAAPAG
jgi:hypothetical protein